VLTACLFLYLGAFLIVIGVFIIGSDPDETIRLGSVPFYVVSAAAALFYLAATYYLGRMVYLWSRRRTSKTVFVLIGVFLLLAVLTSPAPFTYTVVAPG
jgi:drug/metabolite transporter (DMT)-like permease